MLDKDLKISNKQFILSTTNVHPVKQIYLIVTAMHLKTHKLFYGIKTSTQIIIVL